MAVLTEKELHPAMAQPLDSPGVGLDEKHDVDMVEKVDPDALPQDTIMMSPFEDMGIRKTGRCFGNVQRCASLPPSLRLPSESVKSINMTCADKKVATRSPSLAQSSHSVDSFYNTVKV